jgi:hypothetical protein
MNNLNSSKDVSLDKLVEALTLTESELGFQVHRLEDMVSPRTDSEAEYHTNLKRGYSDAKYWVGILKRYHEGRLQRQGGDVGPAPSNGGVRAFVDEEES